MIFERPFPPIFYSYLNVSISLSPQQPMTTKLKRVNFQTGTELLVANREVSGPMSALEE